MTFIVNQQGVIYQKDLGLKAAEIARAISPYDPDKSWQPPMSPAEEIDLR